MFQVGVSLSSSYIYAQAGSYKLPKLLKQGREASSYTTRWYRWIRWMMAEVPIQVVVVVSGCSNTVVIMFCHRHDKFEEELSILPWQRHVQTFPKEERRRWGRHCCCCCCWQHSVCQDQEGGSCCSCLVYLRVEVKVVSPWALYFLKVIICCPAETDFSIITLSFPYVPG